MMGRIEQIAADRMAYAIACLVRLGVIDERSMAADAMLDYARIGGVG